MKIGTTVVSLVLLAGCMPAVQLNNAPQSDLDVHVTFAAREWSNHNDGRVYGGVNNGPDVLSGTLGSYKGCLVDNTSSTIVVLTGAMEFHQPDAHSKLQHVFSKSILGDRAAEVIPVGSKFTVDGLKTNNLSNILLEQDIPEICKTLPVFLTSSETFKPL